MRRATALGLSASLALTGTSAIAVADALRLPPTGTLDFGAFWRAARWAIEGRRGSLYPAVSFGDAGGGTFKGFVNPPHVAPMFIPLGHLSLSTASFVFAALNLVLLAALAMTAWRLLRSFGLPVVESATATLLMVGSAAVSTTVVNGAMSLFVVGAMAAVVFFDRRGDAWLTGLAFGVLSIKPQYAILPFVFLVARRRWRTVGGALISSSLLVGVSLPFTGVKPWTQYLPFLDRYAASLDIWRVSNEDAQWLPKEMLNIRGLLVRALGTSRVSLINNLSVVVLAVGVVVVIVLARHARNESTNNSWAAVIALTVVTSQHTNISDGVLLFVALILLVRSADARSVDCLVFGLLALDIAMLFGNPSGKAPAVPWSALAALTLTGVALSRMYASNVVVRPESVISSPDQAASIRAA